MKRHKKFSLGAFAEEFILLIATVVVMSHLLFVDWSI